MNIVCNGTLNNVIETVMRFKLYGILHNDPLRLLFCSDYSNLLQLSFTQNQEHFS